MAQTLEQLVLRLDAETAEYRANLEKAQKQLETLGEKVDSIADKIQNAFQKEVVSHAKEAAEALVGLAVKGGELAEQMERLSQVTGISTEQIAQLQFAAKETGTSSDTLATSFAKLEKTMAKAASGNSEAKAAFHALGIEFESSPGKLRPVNDVLEDLSKKMGGYKDGAAKTAAAQLLMGKGAAEIIPFLNRLGQEGFKGLEAEAAKFGATLSGPTIRNASIFKETLAKLEAGVDTLSVRLAANLGPALDRIATTLTQSNNAGQLFQRTADTLAVVIKTLASAAILGAAPFAELGREMGVLFATFSALGSGKFKEAAAIFEHFSVGDSRNQLDAAIEKVKELWKTVASAPRPGDKDFIGPLPGTNAPIVVDTKKGEEAVKHLTRELDALHAKIAELKTETAGATINLDVFNAKDLGAKAFEELTQKTNQADAAFAQLQDKIHSGEIAKSLEASGAAAFRIADGFRAAASQVNSLEKIKIVAGEARRAEGELGAELESLNAKSRALGKETETERIAYELAYGKLHTYANEMKLAGQNADELIEKIKRKAASLDRASAALQHISHEMSEYQHLIDDANEVLKSQESEWDRLMDRVDRLDQMLRAGMLTQEQYNREIGRIAGQFTGITQLGHETAQALTDSFANFILNTKEGFGGLVSSFASAMAQILAKWIAEKVIMTGLNLAFGAATGGVGSGVAGLLGFAGGGDPEPGKPAIVGEHGPEIFVPREHGTVYPHNFSQHMSALDAAPTSGSMGPVTLSPTLQVQSLLPGQVTEGQRMLHRDWVPLFREMIRTGHLTTDLKKAVR